MLVWWWRRRRWWKEESRKRGARDAREDAGSESVGDSCRGVAGSISVDRRHKLFQWTQSSDSIPLPVPPLAASLGISLAPAAASAHPSRSFARINSSVFSFSRLSSFRVALTAALSHPGAFVRRLRDVASSFFANFSLSPCSLSHSDDDESERQADGLDRRRPLAVYSP